MRLYKKKYARKLFIIRENDIIQKLIHIVLHTPQYNKSRDLKS